MQIIPQPYGTQRQPLVHRDPSGASQALAGGLRPVGPGRLERGYQRQIVRLNRDLEELQQGLLTLEGSLETARLIERGTGRYLDRLEAQRAKEQAQAKRLLVLVGSLQSENEHWREKVLRLENRLQRIETKPERRPFWRRLLRA